MIQSLVRIIQNDPWTANRDRLPRSGFQHIHRDIHWRRGMSENGLYPQL